MTVTANADGLRFRYGLDTQKAAMVGAPCTYGAYREVIAIVEAGRNGDLTGGLIGGEPNTMIPAGSWIASAVLIVTETFTGTNATVDLGLAIADGTYTGGDEDGIDAAIALSALDVGDVVICDGALVAATTSGLTSVDLYPSIDCDTLALTAGKAKLIIRYIPVLYPDQGTD